MKFFKKCEGASIQSPSRPFLSSSATSFLGGERELCVTISERFFSWLDRIFHTDRNLIFVLTLFCLVFTYILSVCLLIFLVLLKVVLGPVHSGYYAHLTRRSTSAGSLLSRSFEIPLSSNIAVCQRSQKMLFLLKMKTMDPIHRSDLDNFIFK